MKAAPKAGAKKAAPKSGGSKVAASKPAGPGAIAAGGGLDSVGAAEEEKAAPEVFAATGIDNALELLGE